MRGFIINISQYHTQHQTRTIFVLPQMIAPGEMSSTSLVQFEIVQDFSFTNTNVRYVHYQDWFLLLTMYFDLNY